MGEIMKLHTINKNGDLESYNRVKLSLEEYSDEQVEAFLKEANNYIVDYELYSYETDMSDHEETSIHNKTEITAENIVIKNNKFFGCLGWNTDYYKSLGIKRAYVVSLDETKVGFNDSGGYREYYYYWTLTKKNEQGRD